MTHATHTRPTTPVREDLRRLGTLWGHIHPGTASAKKRAFAGKRAVATGVALAAVGAVAACGSSASSSSSAAPTAPAAGSGAVSMATSIATSADSWAMVPMAANPAFWQVFARAGNSGTWQLVTPPGVATNGGLVASANGTSSLTIVVRPSQNLTYSPLAQTANGGSTWSTGGPINASVSASPDALAANGNDLAALLSNGSIVTSSDAGTSWSTLAKPGTIAASPAAKGCGGAVRVTSVSFGTTSAEVLAAGTCGTSDTSAVFSYSPADGWQRVSLPVPGQVMRLTDGLALVAGKSGLSALWGGTGTAWTESAPLAASGGITASGTLATGEAWVLLPGGRAATVSLTGATAGEPQWQLLPSVPAHTSVLASGPSGAVDALAVSGSTMTVWRLVPKATVWTKVQTISVPIQYGSSS